MLWQGHCCAHRLRNAVRCIVRVQLLVDSRRNSFDLGVQLLLNAIEIETIVPIDEIDGNTKMAIPTRATDAMQVRLGVLWKVEIDHDVDSLDINSACQQVRTDQVATLALTEIMEDSISRRLQHLRMRVVARVAKLCDFLGQKLHPIGGITKDDGLVDLQLREESVKAMDLLLLIDITIILGDASQGEFVHEIDLVWIPHMFILPFSEPCKYLALYWEDQP